MFIEENALENVVCEMTDMLSRPQSVNALVLLKLQPMIWLLEQLHVHTHLPLATPWRYHEMETLPTLYWPFVRIIIKYYYKLLSGLLLTHCALVSSYGDIKLVSIGVWWHQAITCTNVDLPSARYGDIHL